MVADALSRRRSDTSIEKDLEALKAEFKMVSLSAIEGEGSEPLGLRAGIKLTSCKEFEKSRRKM